MGHGQLSWYAHTGRMGSQSLPRAEQTTIQGGMQEDYQIQILRNSSLALPDVRFSVVLRRSTPRAGAVRSRQSCACCCCYEAARRPMFIHPLYPTTGGLSPTIYKLLVNGLPPLPYPLPAPWLFARTPGGIATPPSMLAEELALPLLLAASSNSNPCF